MCGAQMRLKPRSRSPWQGPLCRGKDVWGSDEIETSMSNSVILQRMQWKRCVGLR